MRALIAAVAVLISVSSAHAQWITDSSGGAFDDAPLNVAMTAKGRYGFGLRCRAEKTPEALFLTPEKVSDEKTLKLMNAAGPKLRIKIDKGSVIELDGTVNDVDGSMVIVSDVEANVLKEVRDAKTSVAVVITLLGKNYHETTFNASGSKSALGKIMKACKID
ncbi:hypothetical protein [Xanthobacter sp. 126]|uniref:hypothetical protein n=1 Tax=Xanthobacter sp. 126 TaxID=1131814 RepID=UPI0012DEF8E5|nr:hypothetical protein [Xanthobacter sp. 126]